MKDYYKTLGVEKTASKDEIKKAFRAAAHKYHPDKNKNDPASAQKFKEASEAYSVLSDDDKRKRYDMFGAAGVNGGGPGGPGGAGGFGGFSGFNPQDFAGFDFDLGDIFGDIFGGGRNQRGGPARQNRGSDISIDVQLTFEESIFGAEKDISITKASKCQTCHGAGSAPGSSMETCKTCNGKGRINETRRSFIGVFNTTRTCEECHGLGQVPKVKCPTCRGTGVTERREEIIVKIPEGIEDGEMVRLQGMGEAVPFGATGDLYVRVHVRAHPYIRKEGANLVTELGIKLTQALTGGEVSLKTLDGDLLVKIPDGSNTGDVLRIRGKGVPNDRTGKRGDLLIRLTVEMPKKLSREAKKAIEELKKEGL
ncbi:MAG: molecular chaperone DnaJ [Patescibacteria group bacterium]|nr:molecular chaperone DnaJ [Patescibacteria group bacterium]MDE1967221.1 molecular chaperone DnaJ [Patescibacteria group bacterium]